VTLLDELDREPHAFDFFQAVRRMDCAHPDKPQTGHSARAADDPVRFGQEASLAFAPATLHALERDQAKPRLIERFFGLLGPQGPLPLHLTEYVRERVRNQGDSTLLSFFNVFHHRMVSLFYRAWARVRPTVSFDRPVPDRFGDYIGSLFGYGMASLARRDALPDLPKRHFAGLMSCQTRHAEGLLAILRGYFGLPVQIQEFVGQWIELPANCRCLVGLSSSRLGVDTTVGSHVWDCQQKFRVIFGPLSIEDYYRMLPGGSRLSSAARSDGEFDAVASTDGELPGPAIAGASPRRDLSRRDKPAGSRPVEEAGSLGASLDRLIAAVRSYVGDELQWDLQLILRRMDTPPLGLGIVGRLGWSSWLIREQMPRDPDDLVLDAMQVPVNVESAEFGQIGPWDHRTLGQTRDGRYILATDAIGDFVVTEVDVETYQVATRKLTCDDAFARPGDGPLRAGLQLQAGEQP
jgi:type VI secretion system protein ImpH